MDAAASQSEQLESGESRATVYTGPVVVSTYPVAGQSIRLVRPTEPDRMLDEPAVIAWNARDDYMPYWAYLWPGAYLLAEAVMREQWPAGDPEVLEIGCGVGLAGLVAMARGARVRFTDYDAGALEFVKQSVAENGFDRARSRFEHLDWREPPEETFEVILGSDVIYEARLVPVVAALLSKLLAPGGFALIATPYRHSAEAFPAAIEGHGLICASDDVCALHENGERVRGILYRVSWPEPR